METQDLFQSCRRGDLEQVRYLAEHKEVDVNVRDKWDSTPLYYACLCGHLDLVSKKTREVLLSPSRHVLPLQGEVSATGRGCL